MKHAILCSLLLAAASTSAFADKPYAHPAANCPGVLIDARSAEDATNSDYRAGRVSVVELTLAKLAVSQEEFNCRQLGFSDYCNEALPMARFAANEALALDARGKISPELLLKAQLKNGTLQQMCR